MADWLTNNGLQVATLITLAVLIAKMFNWVGVVNTRIDNLEAWLKRHVEHSHGGTL